VTNDWLPVGCSIRRVGLCPHFAILALALGILGAGSALAQDSATAHGNRVAYEWALKCFVANGRAEGMRTRAGDTAKAEYYKSKGHQSFDAAIKLGAILHLSGDQIDEDINATENRELPPMVTDQHYMLDVVANCKGFGLM